MHDVIHDMALWLYCECGKEKNKILVYNDVCRLKEAQEILELKETEKMSLWDKNVEEFPKTLKCPNLKTLIVACNKLKKFPSGFFQFMPLIRDLDLSRNDNLSELPTGIELISSLISLKLFSMYNNNVLSGVEERLLDELESLNGINEIEVHKSSPMDKCGDVISLELASLFLKRMEHLLCLNIYKCNDLKDIKIKLEGEGTQRDVTLPNYIVARENYFHALRENFALNIVNQWNK
ncbi:putative disease resistance protein [Vitis vinifera]|uniref:Putative disease resistance protein n=1 Tax=Vitis vinifera TaxID=29760 RepID=A0A438CK35_VITVI|nr:putative disease resistance protein [Vitis vinifera]